MSLFGYLIKFLLKITVLYCVQYAWWVNKMLIFYGTLKLFAWCNFYKQHHCNVIDLCCISERLEFLRRMGIEGTLTSSQTSNLRVCHVHFKIEMINFHSRNIVLHEVALPVHHSIGQTYEVILLLYYFLMKLKMYARHFYNHDKIMIINR